MDAGVAFTIESGSSQDNVDQVFIYVLGPNRHGLVRCKPLTISPSHYYDSHHMIKLRWKTQTGEEEACTMKEQSSDFQARLTL